MAECWLNGLTPGYRARVNESGVVDFNHLRPEDVARCMVDCTLNVDWTTVIFIKNYRRRHQRIDSIIWTMANGFYRTKASPKVVVDWIMAKRVVGWFDLRTSVKFLKLSGPVPFVAHDIILVSAERPAEAGQTSWLSGRYITHIQPTGKPHQVRILLQNGLSIIIQDTATRLQKKLDEAEQISTLQQKILTDLTQPTGHKNATVSQYLAFRDLQLVRAVHHKAGLQVSDSEHELQLREIYHGDHRSWRLNDEQREFPR